MKNAKVLIINAGINHPPSGGKLNTTLANEAQSYLISKNHEVKLTNLAEEYDPEKEYLNIVWADVVIIQ